ncbi:GGDEF domain-containing protein [Marinicella gelatinilytica]|uniref:GGDEF domain-containing protein n=1 Tax=Marinicella gelatinilytica TaxID=2996017 RepID=UPI002260AC60|nr:GGDEF domain-containing protein [Marinicella gelatinilytica]MCX7543778.1 GGDEF domain-containing protein [Marinicella gelatinilytica]
MNSSKKLTFNKHIDSHKKSVLNVLLLFTFIGGFVFASINYLRGMTLLATTEIVASLVSLGLFIYLKNSHNDSHFKLAALLFVGMFCGIMLIAFSQGGISITVFTFALLIPLLAHLLLGTKTGLVITTFFLMLSGLVFLYRYINHEVFNHPAAIANIITVTLLIWGLSFSYEQANERYKEKLISLASRDFLTGLFNRSMLKEIFQIKLHESIENKTPISLLVADLDRFKEINDKHGHDIGDQVIKQFAEILNRYSGRHGSCFRLGGEEFCVIFSQISLNECLQIAEKIRLATENLDISSENGHVSVTVSIGMTECSNRHCSMTNLLKETDKKMYQAKHSGRNRIVV